ncbi:MAG: hypothetical protein QW689_05490 [Nitrososphaerota archaeon]
MSGEREVVGGYKVVGGELRFIPLKTVPAAHCKSCLFFNRRYESCSRGYVTTAEGDASKCSDYVNRTWRG